MNKYRGTTREIKSVLQHVGAHGYTAELGRSNHWRITDPAGHFVFALPLTPGSNRAAAAARRALRQAGLPPMPTGRHKPRPPRHQALSP